MSKEKRALIVDDNIFSQQTLKNLLRELGWTSPSIAETGEEALEILLTSGGTYDVIILDQKLPRMSGLQTLMLAREKVESLPPVIMITGSNEPILEAEARGLGVIAFKRKSELTEAVMRELLADIG